MGKPLVSVVMCEHNTPIEFLKEALGSVLAQTYRNFELIFVDDFSNTDYSLLSELHDSRVKIIKNKINLGLAGSRNVGIQNSQGKYIAIMDTDDICFNNRFEKQVKFLEKHSDVVCLGTQIRIFGVRNCYQRYYIRNNEYYRCCLLFGNSPTVTNPSTMIRSSFFKDGILKYDESLRTAEDYDMWVQLSKIGKIKILPKVLLNYRTRSGQMSEQFRTTYLNDYNWKIMTKQLNGIGYEDFLKDEKFIRENYLSPKIDAFEYHLFLKKLQISNNKTHFFDDRKFKLRCQRQLKNKIYSLSRNEFNIFMQKATFSLKMKAIFWQLIRPFNLFINIYWKVKSL